uniref:Uncharacterized protein n=1 Tax=Tanacetum cinerariifolium TaxID=118510 RepID=A0A699I3V6_TANCI|nr:hypothetical protein [Tanacetum cinerariifolium]
MVGGNCGNQFRQYAGQNAGNRIGYNAGQIIGNRNGLIVVPRIANQNANQNRNGNVVVARAENNGDIDEIKEFNANYILMANFYQASTSGTQTDKALVYDSDGPAENTEILKPIIEPHLVQQNTSNVIIAEPSVEHNGGTVEQHHAIVKETHAYFESLYNNLVTEVEKVNTVNHKMRETNADLTILFVKENQENDKIRSKPDKNEKRSEAGKSQKQLQSREKEKLKKMQVERPEMQNPTSFINERQRDRLLL